MDLDVLDALDLDVLAEAFEPFVSMMDGLIETETEGLDEGLIVGPEEEEGINVGSLDGFAEIEGLDEGVIVGREDEEGINV